MAHYAIGDIHGCYAQLMKLLDTIQYSPNKDTLWFTGDLVTRGPQSLKVLQFISKLPNVIITLGNHEFRLLTYVFCDIPCIQPSLQEILASPELHHLCHWLRKQPLMHHDATLGYTLVHAGLAPQWSLEQAQNCAKEVEAHLKGNQYAQFLSKIAPHLAQKEPVIWDDSLEGDARWGCIINCFTRIRFCNEQGMLELKTKDRTHPSPEYMPWFKLKNRANRHLNILFGHWAALHGKTETDNVHALDTGCDHGYRLTAMRLETKELISIPCY
jgi:bis(5'-nucleosyl)-tetraphosphatase (symmetrical)